MFDIVALGESLIDFTPSGENSQGIALFARNPGGAPANVLAMAAKLGDKTAFIGKVGDDAFGAFLKKTMEDADFMLFFEGGYCGLDLLKASLRLERFDELPDLVACAAPQCHSALFLIVIGDLNAQMAAAGMNDDINIARIGTIRLDKMVAAAQRADAFFRPLQIDVRRAAKRAQVDGRAVFVGGHAHFPSAGDRAADQRIQLFRIDLP